MEEKEKKSRISKNCGTILKGMTWCLAGIVKGKEREYRAEEILEVIMAENFPKSITDTKQSI